MNLSRYNQFVGPVVSVRELQRDDGKIICEQKYQKCRVLDLFERQLGARPNRLMCVRCGEWRSDACRIIQNSTRTVSEVRFKKCELSDGENVE